MKIMIKIKVQIYKTHFTMAYELTDLTVLLADTMIIS